MSSPETARSRQRLFTIVVLLSLSLLLAQRYKEPLLHMISGHPETTQVSPPPCDLNRHTCQLPIITPVASEAPWSFSITPHPIPVSAPLTLTLTPPDRILAGNQPRAVWVDLTGDSMDMGLIRIALTQRADGHWEGTGSIPVCVTGQMRWRARLHLELEQTVIQADWLFTAPLSNTSHTVKSS